MATFAVIENKMVTNVIVANSKEDAEQAVGHTCIEYTSDNPAGIGYLFDEVKNAFIAPQPFESWILNEETHKWEAPVPHPTDKKHCTWDEETLSWIKL